MNSWTIIENYGEHQLPTHTEETQKPGGYYCTAAGGRHTLEKYTVMESGGKNAKLMWDKLNVMKFEIIHLYFLLY